MEPSSPFAGALRAQQPGQPAQPAPGQPSHSGQQHQPHQAHGQHEQPHHGHPQQPHQISSSMTNISGNSSGIAYRIDHRDSNTLVVANISSGASLKVRPGAMVAMESTVQIRGEVKVSFRKLFTGGELAESIFTGFGEVLLAPDIWGDVIPINIDGQTTWRIGKDAFLACTSEVTRTNKSQGLGKGLFSGEGLFITEVTGTGTLFVQSLGAIMKRELRQGEEWVVDNGHLVAWTATYKIERIKGGSFLSRAATDEGLVCRFTGPGAIYLQTRNPDNLISWIRAQMPSQG